MSAAAVAQFSLQSKTSTVSTEARWSWLAPATTRKPERLDADTSLVERCLAGEQAAWEDLVKTHTRRVYSICYRFTNRDSEAQDLTQDVFVRVFKSLGSFRSGEGSFTVWLARLTRNLLVDHYRRTKQDRVTDAIEDQLVVLEEKTSLEARTDGLLAGREAGELLQAGLQRLSPELREAVILRDLEELEYKEIASVLNVPEGTVKSRLNRGRAELARILRRSVRPVRSTVSGASPERSERTGP
ncbi:MAG TPA: sigma-70 family RNA polymerase sigma factor [Bryobacteraceae bacterium]|jgi:RNA polymerase sigma-70 factor (ECF subfamily)|nr:sigma-70 family RNA polymerase sigma factor [Bryobacteraceae bacterium]